MTKKLSRWKMAIVEDTEEIGHCMEENEVTRPEGRHASCRNLISFWIFGLTNNFAYVIMLSAANDILRNTDDHNHNVTNSSVPVPIEPAINRSGKLLPECNQIGTGAILLADIIPALLIKLTAPYYIHLFSYNIRIIVVILTGAASFPIVAYSNGILWMSVLGVVFASFGSGLGEISFLSLSAFYNKNTVSTWSSGTGAAGVLGSLVYAGLTALGVPPSTAIMMMLIIPFVMALSYFVLLEKHPQVKPTESSERSPLVNGGDDADNQNLQCTSRMTAIEKFYQIGALLKFMIPLGLVYFAEYFINQALFEIIYFEDIWLPLIQQYRWYQVIYQIGVFISRSSVNIVQIRKIWIMPVLQFANVAILLLQVFYGYIPYIWIVFIIILFEGLLGGAAYVNTFFRITNEVSEEKREFSMGATSVADSFGIAIAGAAAVPTHNLLCRL